jgi:hypothetical protein
MDALTVWAYAVWTEDVGGHRLGEEGREPEEVQPPPGGGRDGVDVVCGGE